LLIKIGNAGYIYTLLAPAMTNKSQYDDRHRVILVLFTRNGGDIS